MYVEETLVYSHLANGNHVETWWTQKECEERVPIHPYGCWYVQLLYEKWRRYIYHAYLLGASGTGRTTFVNTLCDDRVLVKKESDNPEDAHNEEGINIKPVSVGKLPGLVLARVALD